MVDWQWLVPAFVLGMLVQQEVHIWRMRRERRRQEERNRLTLQRLREDS